MLPAHEAEPLHLSLHNHNQPVVRSHSTVLFLHSPLRLLTSYQHMYVHITKALCLFIMPTSEFLQSSVRFHVVVGGSIPGTHDLWRAMTQIAMFMIMNILINIHDGTM